MNQGALNDIRVIELGQLIAGPFCGQLLGDMGADIIKVEPPGAGDPMRQWGLGDDKVNWEVIGRNKKCVSANLRVAEGQDIVRRLASTADILIENFKPGTLEKWGLSPEALHAINPRLIIARMSGYGQTGPYSDRRWVAGAILLVSQTARQAGWAFPSAIRSPRPMAAWAFSLRFMCANERVWAKSSIRLCMNPCCR
jgi:crotonobetainyl-CoA:carnitine CoA-transferase CaiB-like acyl-CoA transferase